MSMHNAAAAQIPAFAEPTDLELAALISSKICHDVIGPVGAIGNGFQILDEEEDEEAREYALHVIRNVAQQASVKLEFARFAFGAAGSAGATIDLQTAEKISRGVVENGGKHKLVWHGPNAQMSKDKVKLLLNMLYNAMTALPRGGTLDVQISGPVDRPHFTIRCSGQAARPPQHLESFISGAPSEPLHALTIQPYYTWRLARQSNMQLAVEKVQSDIMVRAICK
jgi:histidine phosphotransferase ChpT